MKDKEKTPCKTVLKAFSCCTATVASTVHVAHQTKVTNLKSYTEIIGGKLGNAWKNIQEAENSTMKGFAVIYPGLM